MLLYGLSLRLDEGMYGKVLMTDVTSLFHDDNYRIINFR